MKFFEIIVPLEWQWSLYHSGTSWCGARCELLHSRNGDGLKCHLCEPLIQRIITISEYLCVSCSPSWDNVDILTQIGTNISRSRKYVKNDVCTHVLTHLCTLFVCFAAQSVIYWPTHLKLLLLISSDAPAGNCCVLIVIILQPPLDSFDLCSKCVFNKSARGEERKERNKETYEERWDEHAGTTEWDVDSR